MSDSRKFKRHFLEGNGNKGNKGNKHRSFNRQDQNGIDSDHFDWRKTLDRVDKQDLNSNNT